MAISKVKTKMDSIGVKPETKKRFTALVEKINQENWKANGTQARKITHDDVLLELVEAYEKVSL